MIVDFLNSDLHSKSLFVKKQARELGFDFCGISRAEKLENESDLLKTWLDRGFHGQMSYLENHFDKRLDPSKLVSGARSVISFLYNYYPSEKQGEGDNYKIAKYAYGRDYHKVIKKLLLKMLSILREAFGPVEGRAFVDSAPVMERQWAAKSGLGWLGKNGLLINRELGSFFFIAELIIDTELEYDEPVKDYCGNCTACIDACPTGALTEPGVLDASKCISYLTIELKSEIPKSFNEQYDQWIFGCDICQDVCPWNKFAKPHNESNFAPKKALLDWQKDDWNGMTEEDFDQLAEGTAMKRTKYYGLKRNINFLSTN